ncbi:L-threonylcarbamoyladenylate synthase [Sphingomonas sp. GCM10030256]|uniref:L-threonylcarbamoyladenylate synthase n=1 Tax=Sphingomonas sp. GCM10030256 TaxID=3273427 RepID=UPI00360C978B
MSVPATRTLPVNEESLAEAARLVLAGQPVAVPTETVYGLAADATNGEAVARVYAAKGRPSFNPLIVHVPDLSAARDIGDFEDEALKLAEQHWPGPLTLIVPLKEGTGIASLVTAGLPTIALRVPAHPTMQALLRKCGRPLAAPSANASGRISPTRAEHVLASLDGRIALVLDGGSTERGIESTIIAAGGGRLRLLRPGPLLVEGAQPVATGSVEAPGMLASHYAPTKPVRLDAVERRAGEWLIGFGEVKGDATLSASGDLIEAASNLFAALHQADKQSAGSISVAPIADVGLGIAINDRLRRAAAARS